MVEIVGLSNVNLDQIQLASMALKKSFRSTENNIWDGAHIAAELQFQVTHLANAILRESEPLVGIFIQPNPGINKGVADETADVLFNLMNLANGIGIKAADTIEFVTTQEKQALLSCEDLNTLAINLGIQAGELWDALFRHLGYKHMIRDTEDNWSYILRAYGGTLLTLDAIAKKLGVDLTVSFQEMHQDASKFLDEYNR